MVHKKTHMAKPVDTARKWLVLDASEAPLGRLATAAAKHLIGKNKPNYTPHIDAGDYVIVVNAAKLVATGAKAEQKMYYHHSGYPGGLKEQNLKTVLATNPSRAVIEAVKGMLPKNKLQPARLERLKVFVGEDHSHAAQKPVKIGVKE